MYALIFFWVSALFAAEKQFDFSTIDFLKEPTLKTWVAEKFHNPEDLKKIQEMLSKQVYGCPGYLEYSYTNVTPEKNNPYPGRTIFILSALYLPYLQAVHDAGIENNKSLSIIEMGVAWGLKFWPLYYALTHPSTIYANDLSTTVISRFNEKMNEAMPFLNNIVIERLFGIDCNTLINNPSLEGKMDFILSENVCQNFNPLKHQDFLGLIHYLLKPSGKAFISGVTFNCKKMDQSDPIFQAYITAKNNNAIYPGFLATELNSLYDAKTSIRLYFEIIKSWTPSDDTEYKNHSIKTGEAYYKKANERVPRNAVVCKTFEVVNHMTPAIFRNSVLAANKTKGTDLTVVDAFFMNYAGARCDEFVPDQRINWAAAIIQKNS